MPATDPAAEVAEKLKGMLARPVKRAPKPCPVKPLAPGLHLDIAESVYHTDPCEAPSLSASIAKLIVEQSPLHAWRAHPRLGGSVEERTYDRHQAIGTAAHKMLLGRGTEIVTLNFRNYQSGEAKQKRDEAIAAGCCPLLECDLLSTERMVEAARDQLLAFPELRALVDGEGAAEAVLVWRDGGIWCRGLVDWMHPTKPYRADLKTTSASAHPGAVSSRLFNTGAEIQDRHYHHGCRAVGRRTERSFFIMLEDEEPHALSVVELDDRAKEVGDEKLTYAIETWDRCLTTGEWPGYTPRVAVAECPSWHVTSWNNRQLAYGALAEAERPRPEMLTEIAS